MRQMQIMRNQGKGKQGLDLAFLSKASSRCRAGGLLRWMGMGGQAGGTPGNPLSPEMCGGRRTLHPALIPQESGTALKRWVCSP